jgi:hypothetical protein
MRIAYFLMLHDNFAQAKWLIDAIYTSDDYVLIHIDANASDEFQRQVRGHIGIRSNVKYLAARHLNRFGWSIVTTELQAIKELVGSKEPFDYLINMSGQDYPIKSIAGIKAALSTAWPRIFVEVIPFARMAEHDPEDNHLARRFAFEMFGRLVRTQIQLPFPKSLDVKFKGSGWFMLTRGFCEWLLSNPVVGQAERLVKYTWTPDELFFQVVVMNSTYQSLLAEHYGREIIWPRGKSSPKTLTMEDYQRLSASSALFARKFDQREDRQILVSLARDHGYHVPAP